MSHIHDPAFEDAIRLTGVAAVAFCALFVPPLVLHTVGLGFIFLWLEKSPSLVYWPVFLLLWSLSFVGLLGAGRGLIRFAEHLVPHVIHAVERMGEAIGAALFVSLFATARLARELLALAIYPVRCLAEAAAETAKAVFGHCLQAWREEQELRRLYNEEFRSDFPSFRAFKAHFRAEAASRNSSAKDNTGGREREREPEPPKPDPFAAACRLVGLPETGSFTAAELRQRYLTLIKGVHPDVAGPNELAVQINAALTLIRGRKGWS